MDRIEQEPQHILLWVTLKILEGARSHQDLVVAIREPQRSPCELQRIDHLCTVCDELIHRISLHLDSLLLILIVFRTAIDSRAKDRTI